MRSPLHGTVEWTNWSRLGSPRVYNGLTGTLLAASPTLPLEYDDGWFFSVGGEYRINPAWTVRAGVGYEISPIDVENRNPRLPDSDRVWLSLGATYNWSEQLSFDVAYSHLFTVGNTDIDIRPGHPSFRGARVRGRCGRERRHHLRIGQVPLGQSGQGHPGPDRPQVLMNLYESLKRKGRRFSPAFSFCVRGEAQLLRQHLPYVPGASPSGLSLPPPGLRAATNLGACFSIQENQ